MNKELKTVLIFAGVFVLLATGAGAFVYNTMEAVEIKEQEIAALSGEIQKMKTIAKQEPELETQLNKLQENLGQYVKILPSPEVATDERILRLVNEKCNDSNFELNSVRLEQKAGKAVGKKKRGRAKGKGGFQEVSVTLRARATYDQFLRFLNSLERNPTFLRVNNFSCSLGSAPVGPTGPMLSIKLNVSTFRYETGGK